jgi:uncharacterized protein YhjY with autotransporter beta-barrel domain
VAPAVSVGVSAQGVGIASSAATAKAVATAIDAGSGSDDITNRGELSATAVANADAVNVAVISGAGLGLAGNPVWHGGTTSEAIAKGIDADGTGTSSASDTTLTISAGEAVFVHRNSETSASGDDRIMNMNKVDATATAVSAGLTVGVAAASGVSGAISTSTAKSEATAIVAGAGGDEIRNSGELAATATSVAASVNTAVTAGTGVAIAADAVFDGGTTAQATAKGIDADGNSTDKTTETTMSASSDGTTLDHRATVSAAQGQDIIVNEGKIDAIATAVAPSVGVAVAVSGVGVAASTATAQAEATAIDAGAGNDSITNRGKLAATAVATAAPVNVAVTPAGVAVAADAVWSGGTTAEAIAKGIDADGSGIDSESQTTLVVNSDGPSIRHFRSVQAAAGNDAIANEARIEAAAVAVAPSISVSVAVSGVGVSASTATAKAEAMAIDGGGGDDSITNKGELNATATSVAAAVNVSVTPAGVAVASDAIWSGGTTADAVATGIYADGNKVSTQTETTLAFNGGNPSFNHQSEIRSATGNDTITNEAKIDTNATAVSGSIGVSVAVAGVAAAASTATARADATAINAGGGDDSITNEGDLSSTAVANANAVVVSVTPAGVAVAADAVWDGGTTAEATATGISADGKAEAAQSQTTISAHEIRNKTVVASVSGNDNILNEGTIDATAVAVSPAVDVAVAVAGVGAAVANSTAKADATAIDAGGGNDSITNRGDLTATSVANADTLNVSVSVTGVGVAGNAVWDGGTTVEATATGIDADGKGSRITTERNIDLSSDRITIVKRTTQESDSGSDVIVNEGKVVARATAVPVSVAVGVAAVGGVGAAFSTSTAKSSATAINAGGGSDNITNTATGELTATATSTAVTVNGSFSLIGAGISADAVWDGGTTAEATAVGIDADGQGSRVTTERTITVNASGVDSDTQTTTESADGNDIIINEGKITAKADANSPSVAIGLGGILGAAISTSTAKSQATAIAAGAGDDEVHNSGELEATAESTAVAVNASVSVGAALSVNNFWDGGTTAEATAKGIDGGEGKDTITNAARIEAVATAKSPSVSVALGGIVGAAISTATARAKATAIDAGDGDDTVDNTGELHARADSSATTVNVSESVWAAVSWDGGTTAEAEAKGIDAGDGKDTITNTARIEADATAKSPSVSVALGGVVGAAISTATARANSTAIDAGDDDDTIVNHGLLIANSEADADAVSVAVTFGVGLAVAWDGGTTAEAISKGIDTGAGSDTLTNHGLINATSTANTTSTAVAVVLGGVSAALAGSTATARSAALDGGDGDDTIANHGPLTAHATADARGTSVSVALVGAAAADTASNAIAQATGIDGGQGNDTISNSAQLGVMALATAKGTSVEVAVVGATVANPFLESGTKADATAIGLTGGAGIDTVTNFSTINLGSTAKTDSTAVSVSLLDFGGGSANVSADAKARGTGIEGGAGSNILDNRGVITAAVTAESPVRGVNVSLAGVAQADFSTNADASAHGISGGEGDDEITNSGVIELTSTARAPASGTSVNIAGVTEQSVSATATASATGVDGGEGDDAITNSGMLIARALSEATVSGSSWTLAGRSAQQGISTAVGQATGISGGGGADVIVNEESIVVSGTTTLRTEGNSSAAFGGTTADASVNGNVAATGIDGGGDDDQIHNAGAIAVTATSNSTAVGSSFTLGGSATGKSGTTATATGIGMAGGLGDDLIVNSGVLTSTAASNATASNSAWTLAGASGGNAALQATSKSVGIAGDAGADHIYNHGQVSTDASATLNVTGGAQAIFGGAGSGSAVSANLNAIGIDGGDGDDWIENRSRITVRGTAGMTSSTAAFSFTGSPSAAALLTATSQATGISGGSADDWIHNLGSISVLAQSQQTATGGSSSTVAGSAASSTASRASASAAGVDSGTGDDIVINDGTIAVDANPTGTARNVAAGGFLFGTAGARSDLNLTSTSSGVVPGEGDNVLSNTGEIAVKARGDGLADAKADGGRLFSGSAFATATVSGGGVAYGVKAGDGDNWIFNDGSLSVVAEPRLRADKVDQMTRAGADANGNGITNANGTALATASTTGKAIGIEVGHGDNRITNNGLLSVSALPEAKAVAFADSDLVATARATAIASASAEAAGIRAGNGNNQIVNNGTITVLAAPTANAEAQATADKISISICIPFTRICREIAEIDVGQAIATSQFTESATAIGIETGSGDDTIVNNGTIAATQVQNDVSSRGVAISSGAGNDTVMLGDGSLTTGHIELGSGNDTFHLVGTPTVDGNINSGSGTNSLIFEGTGSFSNPLVGFINTLKQGAGTYTLPTLSTMERLEVKEGTLQLNSNYTMGSGSTFQTIVSGDGTHGQLKVGGTAGLDGALVVDKGPGAYSDGATFDIVSANTVSGSFASEALPDPTALVSFSTNQLPAAFQVEASVASFTSVTNNSVGFAVASALDTILPNATGDMSRALGSLQQLTQSDFNKIYAGISGESYDHFRASTFSAMRRYSGVMHSRMNQMRAAFRGMTILEGADRTQMSQDALLTQYGPVSGVLDLLDNSSAGQLLPRYGMWLSTFGQAGGQKTSDGYSGFNYLTTGVPFGFDFPLSNNLIAGFAAGQSVSDIIRDQAVGRTEGTFSAMYATYFTRNAHVEAVLSRGWNLYENRRVMDLGNETRLAASRHGGDAYSAALEGRYRFDFDALTLEPFSSLHYSRLVEDAFLETGAGSLNLIVNKRETESLSSQLGFRVVSSFSMDSGKFVPEFTAAWKHDFTPDRRSIIAAFSGAPDSPFELQGKEVGREGLELGAALTFVREDNFSLSAGFTAELGENREEVSGLLQFEYKW